MELINKVKDLFQNNIANLFQNNISSLLNKKTIGLDIGSNLIKIVSAELHDEEIVLKNLAVQRDPSRGSRRGEISRSGCSKY